LAIHVALHHKTHYAYDRPVGHSPHVVRLRPAPHCRTRILGYSLNILPKKHFINWQQDPFANWNVRIVFPEKSTELSIEVDVVAEMAVYNPFDFFLEPEAEQFPFDYDAALEKAAAGSASIPPPACSRARATSPSPAPPTRPRPPP